MEPITREQLKREIDTLNPAYLELAYRILQQFPHAAHPDSDQPQRKSDLSKPTFSQRWQGKLGTAQFSPDDIESDPRLAYLVQRYNL